MDCKEWRDKIPAYADGELPAAAGQALEAHLRACSTCASAALAALTMKRAVRQAGRRHVARAALRSRVEQQVTGRGPSRVRTWLPSLAAAAVTIVVILFGVQRWVPEGRRQTLTELADLHVAALASSVPVDVVSSDRHTVKPWFAGRIPFTFDLPELQGTALQLVGGRVTYMQQEPGAHLLFQIRQHRVSVFIFRDLGGVSRGPEWAGGYGKHSAFNCETWNAGGLRCFVMGDAAPGDIRQLSDLLREAAR